MKRKDYTEANRLAWNERAHIHQEKLLPAHLESFKDPSFSTLDDIITTKLHEIDLKGKTVAQLCCNNGREILSIKNLGAERAVGFDISNEYIDQGNRLIEVAENSAELVCIDLYDIPDSFNN